MKKTSMLVSLVLATALVSSLLLQNVFYTKDAFAEAYENPATNNRETIDMGETPWRFIKSDMEPNVAKQIEFDDSSWQSVGIPHCYNDTDTFTNTKNITMYKGTVWYRKNFTIDKELEGKKLLLEFEGVNIGAAVYINGKFKEGNTTVAQLEEVTHVGGFLPFTLDITDDVNYGGDNVVAVRVSNTSGSFFTWPGFGTKNDFGMAYGGIVNPVNLHITDKIHIPENVYSPTEKWGTYIATMSADENNAEIRFQTNVENESDSDKEIKLITEVVDEDNNIVLSLYDTKTIQSGDISMFDQTGNIANPSLWYPNASVYGTPYLYKVYSKVEADGSIIDVVENPLGIRTITWDKDYGYINGKKHLLNGFGNRNTYPALGSAIPADIQWRDIELIAEAGGNALRVGHVRATSETLAACDKYGVMVIQNSGDDEWSIHDEPANTYKKEYDRDMIVKDRNHPSIVVWEANNGMPNSGVIESPKLTYDLVQQWDYLKPRIVHARDSTNFDPGEGNLMIGYTNWYWKQDKFPTMNMESYGAKFSNEELDNCIARFDYENEKTFSNWYINEYNEEVSKKACGFIDWMLVETWGEGYTKYLNGMRNQKSLGSSAMDGNRVPKLKYNIWKNAVWTPYEVRPGVTLQSHWNFNPGTTQTVDAWSNCASVELFVNGVSKGVKTPNSNKNCTWYEVAFEAGSLKVVGLDKDGVVVCEDKRITAGEPDHIELSVIETSNLDGSKYDIKANGSDAAIIEAKIVDKDGNWCPFADQNLNFSVSGPATYRGSYNFYVVDDQGKNYHAPGDHELQAEGGLMRITVRSGFVAGEVTVAVTADGLGTTETTYATTEVGNNLSVSTPDFNLVSHSLENDEISSLPVGENKYSATYQNLTNETKQATLIVALKKDDVATAVYNKEKEFAPFEEYNFEQVIDVPEIGDNEDVQVEAYLWDNTSSIRPQYGVIKKKINNVSPVITINDTVTGSGINQIEYFGDWGYSSNEVCYDSDNHWTNESSRYCVMTFEGIQATYYAAQADNNGIAAVSVDGGPEVMVDLYSPSSAPSSPLYITLLLPYGKHTLKIRVTGDKNPNSEYSWVNVDRFDIRSR